MMYTAPSRRQQVIALLRRTHLLPLAEWARHHMMAFKTQAENAAFLKEHPGFVPPPAALMHDAHSTISYRFYMESGLGEARMVAGLIAKYHPSAASVLEWGCGPARILRHMPALLPAGTEVYGTDYNKASIAWCSGAIPTATFAPCDLAPPLPFERKFDVIYAISVLTHLSVVQQDAWVAELTRALNPGGILIITTHGERCTSVLLPEERRQFDTQGVVIRSGVEEGKRCYGSYHHPDYARNHLFAGLQVLEHIAENPCPNTAQDVWVLSAGR